MESYSRGRRGVPAKDVGVQKAREGSNPSLSAKGSRILTVLLGCDFSIFALKVLQVLL